MHDQRLVSTKQRLRRLLGTLFLFALFACRSQTPPTTGLIGNLPLKAPAARYVGESIPVTIGPFPAPDGTDVSLVLIGSYGPRVYHTTFQNRVATFVIPPEKTRHSGGVTLVAIAGEARGETQVTLHPGPPTEPLVPLVGGRSIVANGEEYSMAVVVPFDEYGNPVADGTPVQVRALHPGNLLEEMKTQVSHLVAWTRIFSGIRAGRTTISIEVDGKHGPAATIREVPGWPVPFTISAEPDFLPADGHQLMTLRTSTIQDKFGNVVPDGTIITFVVETPTGKRRMIPAYTIEGQAEVPLQAAQEPGIFTVWATVYGVESPPLQVAFTAGPAVGTFPIKARLNLSEGALFLTAGPILGPLRQYVPDGTTVLFRITDPAGATQWLSSVAEDGYATLELRLIDLQSGVYLVSAIAGSGQGTARFVAP